MPRHNSRQLSLSTRRPPRKRRGPRPRPSGKRPEPHRSREVFTRRRVLHVRLRLRRDIPGLRRLRFMRLLGRAFTLGCLKPGFSICQFSIQNTHLHLVVEADNHEALARGMQGFAIRTAKSLNKKLGRRGSVFAERYRVTRVTNAQQARTVLSYVLHNARRHGLPVQGADPFSSARYFNGFSRPIELPPTRGRPPPPVAPAKTTLLKSRWRYLGLIDPDETPRGPTV